MTEGADWGRAHRWLALLALLGVAAALAFSAESASATTSSWWVGDLGHVSQPYGCTTEGFEPLATSLGRTCPVKYASVASATSLAHTQVVITTLPSRMTVYTTVTVRAKVTSTGGPPTGRCQVQRFIARRWDVIATGDVSAGGMCTMTIRIGRVGREQLRVRYLAQPGSATANAVSAYRTVTVTSSGPPVDSGPIRDFRTPSGNITCSANWNLSFAKDSVVCDVHQHSWRVPPPPPGGCGDIGWGQPELFAHGRGHFRCTGGAASGGRGLVLGYGTSHSFGPFRCTSQPIGLTCRNKAGHGMFLSRTRYRFF